MDPLKVFVSYSHQDEAYLSELEKHLSTLKRENLISTWHDRKIVPGQEWEKAIEGACQDSDIFIFLISPDFIASEYCIGKEVALALEKHDGGEAIVIPIVVRPADWLSTQLGKIQALPKDAVPISRSKDRDQAWLEVVHGIRASISDLNKRIEIRSSEPRFSYISSALTSFVEQLEIRYSQDANVGGMPTGLHDLDLVVDGVHAGDLIYVASSPVMDRMALFVSIINHLIVEHSRIGLIFALRQSKSQVATRLCSGLGKIPVHAMQRGELVDEDWSRLTHALGILNDAHLGIIECPSINIETLIEEIDKFIRNNDGCNLVLIDYFEHVTGGNKAKLISKLGHYARNIGVPIIIGGGLENDPSQRPNKRPVLRDIGEWAVLNEDLDIVVCVYQDEKYNPDSVDRDLVELLVEKNQRGNLGTVATVLNNGQALENFQGTIKG